MRVSKHGCFRAAAIAGAVILAGCGSDSTGNGNTGGNPINDPAGLTTSLDAVVGTLNTGALTGLGALPNAAANVLAGLSAGHDGGGVFRQMLQHNPIQASSISSIKGGFLSYRPRPPLQHRLASNGTRSIEGAVIDNTLYSTSYVYNPGTQQYEDDGQKTGPVDGVSFVLYAVDSDGNFTDPLTQTGTLLVHDLSDETTTKVGVEIKGLAGENLADYDVTIVSFDPETLAYAITSGGTLSSDGVTQYDFTYAENLTDGQNYTDDITFEGNGVTLTDHFGVAGDQLGGAALTVDATFGSGGETVRVAGTLSVTRDQTVSAVDLKVYTNDVQYAAATTLDEANKPIFLKSNGEQISAEEYSFLVDLVTAANDISNTIYNLVQFALLML